MAFVGVVDEEEEELRLLLNERHNEVILDNRKASRVSSFCFNQV